MGGRNLHELESDILKTPREAYMDRDCTQGQEVLLGRKASECVQLESKTDCLFKKIRRWKTKQSYTANSPSIRDKLMFYI